MMRTPFLVLARFSAERMFLVCAVIGVCRVMKSARASSSSSSTFSTPRSCARSGERKGSKATTRIFRPMRAVGDDRADIAAADDAERLAGDLDAHEAVLFPFAGLGRGVGGGNFARQREHHGDGVFGGGDGIAEGRVHHDDAARRGGGNVDIVDADAGAADDFQVFGAFEDLGRDLGRRADGEAVVIADDRGELVLVLAERRLEIDLDAALLENSDGGGRKSVGNEHARRHVFLPGRTRAFFPVVPKIVSRKQVPAARRDFRCPGGSGIRSDEIRRRRVRPWRSHRPSRAIASAARRRTPPPSRRTRRAGRAGRRDRRRCRSRPFPSRRARRVSWRKPPAPRRAERSTAGSTTLRQTEVLERIGAASARNPAQALFATQSARTLALASARAISPPRPPTLFAQFSASI